ncbi:hypothetical protein SAMN05428949_5590 [Chitinophaga sp. YR627]|uniref:hypothetical protein n=1 Tax=Chitinophaga sp. YR627 TaxID=1881041 RepID=UPI0008F196F7|nr:hypothetical protein [Chitinophaga sp. YR627]SFO52873.1 hypothetical protein SAMN05428949_5590 [Chitinophaga sp. YR627]
MTAIVNCLKINFLLLLTTCLCQAQSSPLGNPSFEGIPGISQVPAPWFFVEGDADTYPLVSPIPPPLMPKDGKTYIQLLVQAIFFAGNTYEGKVESVGQQLSAAMVPGTTYLMTMDVAVIPINNKLGFQLALMGAFGWDGAGVNNGTYGWVVRYIDSKGQAMQQMGAVSLIR